MRRRKLWEELEGYLINRQLLGEEFNSIALAVDLDISRSKATRMIQAYLEAQRRQNSKTLCVLSRQGRTANAMWHVGARTYDVRLLTKQCLNDMTIKVTDALTPDLRRMIGLNPRTTRVATAFGNAFVANLEALAASLEE